MKEKSHGDIGYRLKCFTLSKAKPQDASFISSAIKPATWISLSDELPKSVGYPIRIAAGVKII